MKPARLCLLILLSVNLLATTSHPAEPLTLVNYSYDLETAVRVGFSEIVKKSIGGTLGGGEGNLGGSPISRTGGDSLVADDGTASASAVVLATGAIGGLHVLVQGTAASNNSEANVIASATASWLDEIQLAVPFSSGLGFSSVFVNALLSVHGDMLVEGNGMVSLSIRDADHDLNTLPVSPLQSAGFSPFTWGFVQKAGNDIRLLPPAQIPVRIGMFLGGFDPDRGLSFATQPVGYEFKLDLTAHANGGHSTLSNGDYSNTVSWAGITSVETSSGAPVTNYVLTSASGFDYSRPYIVPEPTSVQLLAPIISALVGSARLSNSLRLQPRKSGRPVC